VSVHDGYAYALLSSKFGVEPPGVVLQIALP
jgi:hypothetical protein